MRHSSILYLFAPLTLIACAADKDAPAAQWMGETPHFVMQGSINDENVDVSIEGADAASGAMVWCKRGYLAPRADDGSLDLTRAYHSATEIAGYVTVNGEERSFEFELRNHSFQTDPLGSSVRVVPRVDGIEPAADAVWADWEWHSADGLQDLYEASAQDGAIELKLYSGTPGEGGVMIPAGEGSVGGLLRARWSLHESLTISFTVPCVESEVEEA